MILNKLKIMLNVLKYYKRKSSDLNRLKSKINHSLLNKENTILVSWGNEKLLLCNVRTWIKQLVYKIILLLSIFITT